MTYRVFRRADTQPAPGLGTNWVELGDGWKARSALAATAKARESVYMQPGEYVAFPVRGSAVVTASVLKEDK